MTNILDFHPVIQGTIRYLSGSSLQELGEELKISKQAVHKRISKGVEHLKTYGAGFDNSYVPRTQLDDALHKIDRLEKLLAHLKQTLILTSVERMLLQFFKAKVLEWFAGFKMGRFSADQKKQILDWLNKFKQMGGLIKVFAKTAGLAPKTLSEWQKDYDKHGLSGLTNKPTRPKHWGHKVPLWIKEQLIALFLKFPRWTPYQYHSYICHNPTTRWYVSLPTIQKLKNIHRHRSEEEKKRIKKRWCFAPGTDVWTVDFTCILKTENFKLQLLTVSDQRSRFFLHTALYLNTSTETVIDELKELFIRYGKPPLIVKADNGPEFKTQCENDLRELSVYLLNNPEYYGQFNGAHERLHRMLKTFITQFDTHQNLTRLVEEIRTCCEQYNYDMPSDYLGGKTPSEIFLNDKSTFVPKGTEVITPYEKDGELRMKFKNRNNEPARMAMPLISTAKQR